MVALVQTKQGHVAVLVNHIAQTIKLIADLDVVGSAPSTLEERHILIELIVLAGIIPSVCAIIGLGESTGRLRQTGRQGITVAVGCADPRRAPLNVRLRRRPAEIVIISKEVPVARGGDDMRGKGYVRTHVVGRIRIRPTNTM